jgi:hypothetical protein
MLTPKTDKNIAHREKWEEHSHHKAEGNLQKRTFCFRAQGKCVFIMLHPLNVEI